MPVIPFGPHRPDISDLNGEHTQFINNVLPRTDGYGPAKSLDAFSGALVAACRGAFYARKTDGTIVVFAATASRLYVMNNSTLAWTDVSKGGVAYSTLPNTDNWQFAQFGNNVVAVQANVTPQVFDISVSSAFADLGGSPPTSRYITVGGRFLVMSGLISNPNRVHWSGLDAITTWTAGTSFSNFVDFPDGGVVRGVAGGEFGLILQESATRRMVYVPGASPAFQIERLAEEIGLLGPYSLIRAGGRVFFYSSVGFLEFSAGGIKAIGKEMVDRTFALDLDTANLRLLVGAQDPESTRVFWAYKSLAGSSNLFDKARVYDYALQRWSVISVSGEYLVSIVKPGLTLEGLDSISSSIDALTFSLDEVSAAVLSSLAAFDSSHRLSLFSGSNLEATLETAEQAIADRRVFVRGIRPMTDAATVYGSIKYRATQQAAATTTAETLINAEGVCPQRRDTRYARARLRIPAATLWTYASGVEPDFTSTGAR